MKRPPSVRALLLAPLLLSAQAACTLAAAAPVPITFWHSMEGVRGVVDRFADDFNRSQKDYVVTASSVGNYRDAADRVQAAIRAGTAPVLFQAEYTIFNRMAAQGQLLPLGEAQLPADLTRDLYPAVWAAGEVGGARYGLPWNVSTPALFYNAAQLRKAGLTPPGSWSELERDAARLKTGGNRPYLAVADSWTFEAMVDARGGRLVVNGRPNFTSVQAITALEQLVRMSQAGTARPRTLGDALGAAIDFARGQNTMVVASVANWTDFSKIPFFELGAAPMPCEDSCALPIGGANLAVLKGATPQQQAGAVAFWRFLMEPQRLAEWVKASAYMTPRRSVQPLLAAYYAQNPYRKATYAQLDNAVLRPQAPQYADWQPLLEDAMTRAMTGKLSVRDALSEAQRRAEALMGNGQIGSGK